MEVGIVVLGFGVGVLVGLAGTAVRRLLRDGGELPAEFTRPEVAEVLRLWAARSAR